MKRFLAIPLALALMSTAIGEMASAQRAAIVQEQRPQRITLRPMPPLPVPRPIPEWKESRGSRCIARDTIVGAAINGPSSVDFILRDRTRHRARLQNSCPALDYYRGFYLKPTTDGRICQDRDAVHSRSGGECQIDRFRKLTPAKAR